MTNTDRRPQTQDDSEFLERSHALYKRFNQEKLYYKQFSKYNKLITADPFFISPEEYKQLVARGPHLWDWIDEQNNMFKEIHSSPSLRWVYDILRRNHSPKTLEYQFRIVAKEEKFTRIMRIDLSSFPFNCHEAQLRWGAIGHIHSIANTFNELVPPKHHVREMNENLKEIIRKMIDDRCPGTNDCAIYLTPPKFIDETEFFAKDMDKLAVMLVSDFNEQNFLFTGEDLIHKPSGRVVRLVFRRELTLETLSRTEFGRKVVDLYLVDALDFEPDLNLINDSKLGMAFAYDVRTRSLFSDNSRDLFLKTSLYDDSFYSFNFVFGKDYSSLHDFLKRTSQKQRGYIYKYGGYDLSMSFGSSHVYRLDRTKNKTLEIITQTKDKNTGEWIVQELDETRYGVRYMQGDYSKPKKCSIGYSPSCAGRFMIFYLKDNGNIRPILGIANFVNDYWKARFKDSDHTKGIGAIVTPIRVNGLHSARFDL